MGDRRLQPDGDLHTKAAVLTGKAALCHLAAVLLQQIVKAGPQLIRILQLHQNFLCREGVRPHREAVKNDLDGNEDSRLEQAQPIHTGTHSHTDGGGTPHTGGGGQSADRVAVFEYDTGTQKGYTADHLGGNACRVGAAKTIQRNTVQESVF